MLTVAGNAREKKANIQNSRPPMSDEYWKLAKVNVMVRSSFDYYFQMTVTYYLTKRQSQYEKAMSH
ncbi:hypothetical protein SOMG_02655 [Schizosaccharomyces osmophilus]|uniref:Uncharacterized protein n=1 Tax=Schizosaccharomyces osmophilus TaxID=2545709 RepID=A0AAE9WD25_9SCHI|nr:uncharacterized protein SOMG_02655 [Schizosaccharomyces osmophilus]WBW74024.1 hypothetical protein SOMG_02655 [Schizosaccharomyces osmophilus]